MAQDQTAPVEQLLADIAARGDYPIDAYVFVSEGLSFAARKVHGDPAKANPDRHVSGQQLCEGLREYAKTCYGMMAGIVLRRWGLTRTLDFGKIVYAMIDGGLLGKSDSDDLDDFRDVFTFKEAFDGGYAIPPRK